jgi:transketolase C-terminal domain/subunit
VRPGSLVARVVHTPAPLEQARRIGVQDQFDVTLEDSDLLGEVELTTNLIIAASEADEHLSTSEIDKILGVQPED